ncbi:MAG TPA: hypothetical protein VGL46_00505 [Pseudonocardiaceae bacterium]|jgi:hypothetical protein
MTRAHSSRTALAATLITATALIFAVIHPPSARVETIAYATTSHPTKHKASHPDSGSDTAGNSASSGDSTEDQANADSGDDRATRSRDDAGSGTSSKSTGGAPEDVRLRTTGYSFQDNTPPNSNTISCGTVHKVADGNGTYDNPITVAVPGHGGHGAQIPCGTRIYYKDYKFYGIVEDTGATDFPGQKHTDIWVDGRGYTAKQSKACMDPVTQDSVAAILNPPTGLPTRSPGPITRGDTCAVGTSSNPASTHNADSGPSS